MITATGFSNEHKSTAEGVVITFGREMFEVNGGAKAVLKNFLETMADPENAWMHKMLRWPTVEVLDVYIICMNRLWGRVKFGWYEKEAVYKYSPADPGVIEWPRMCIVGPFERCPFKRELIGFQGFRYSKKLF